ncbi:DUF5954 family protein [Solwaraspora sp. WMMB335]|uniref:DUF5954 family protein n=1 Tax=Solwaraspora sp. WMMB335 TaxID=3404118 RepID=UPI003B964485
MAYHGEQVPPHLLIKIEHRDDPVSAVAEQDARQRARSYPTLMWGAPVFGCAEQIADGWRIISLLSDQPQGARDGLASYLRRLHAETADTTANSAIREEYRSAYEKLDWEPVDETMAAGCRYRIIRAQTFIRMGPDGPEPPRPTDPDPYPPQDPAIRLSRFEGFVIDPAAATGLSGALLRMEMAPAYHKSGTDVPDDVRADSEAALISHPNVVILPACFTVGEQVDGRWRPRSTMTYATPQGARDSATFSWTDVMPAEDATHEEMMAAFRRALAERKPPETDEFEVKGVRCRVTRVESFVRVGADGPEGPRPSDWDPDPPPALHVQQLREQGLMPDPD